MRKGGRKFEIAARMRTSNEFSHNSRVRELMLAKCTHIMVSLLKAWKLTVVGIECDDAAFECHFKSLEGDRGRDRVKWCHLLNVISRRSTPEIVLSMNFSNFCK